MFMGMGVENFDASLKDRFDVVTASGVFLPKHMPADAIDDAHAALKVGGYMVTAMRGNLWAEGEDCGYKDKFDELVAAGKFKLVRTKDFWRGTSDGTGLFAKQQSILVVMQKIAI